MVAIYQLQDTLTLPYALCSLLPLCEWLPAQIQSPGCHLKTGGRKQCYHGRWVKKKTQGQRHWGCSVEADAHRAKSWMPPTDHTAPSQAGGPFLKRTEWYVSMSAMLVPQETCPYAATGICKKRHGPSRRNYFHEHVCNRKLN